MNWSSIFFFFFEKKNHKIIILNRQEQARSIKPSLSKKTFPTISQYTLFSIFFSQFIRLLQILQSIQPKPAWREWRPSISLLLHLPSTAVYHYHHQKLHHFCSHQGRPFSQCSELRSVPEYFQVKMPLRLFPFSILLELESSISKGYSNDLFVWFFFGIAEIYAFSSNDIKVGSNIEVDGAPWKVLGIVSKRYSVTIISF